MAYSTSSPPNRITDGPLTGAGAHWAYSSADTAATVDSSGYFTNGGDLGMKVGDMVYVTVTGTGVTTGHRVVTVSSTAPGAVDLGDGVALTSATNTD